MATLQKFDIVTSAPTQPKRIVLYGPEGCGKTSTLAYAPGVVFMQTKGETGLETLIDAGRLPDTPHFPGEMTDYENLIAGIRWLGSEKHEYKSLVLDAVDGAEELIYDHVRAKHFEGSKDKFDAYGRGVSTSVVTTRELLHELDNLRAKGMNIFLVAHSVVATTLNPDGEDYDRYTANLHKKTTWPMIKKWADAVLFMNFFTKVKDGKASGGKLRYIYTEHSATYDAKNRYGLAEEIDAGDSAEEAWGNLVTAFTNAKKGN